MQQTAEITPQIERSLVWTESKKQRQVESSKDDLRSFLTELDEDESLVNPVMDYYHFAVEQFNQKVEGPAHDEYHMAKVVHWAIDIWQERKDEIPEEKRKVAGLALMFAAIGHDLGDIPQEGEAFAQSSRSESRSASLVEKVIEDLSLPEKVDSQELIALTKLMVASTDQRLEMGFGGGIDDLGIAKLITGDEDDLKFEEAQVVKESLAVLISDYGWSKENVLEVTRVLNAADYASYFFEPAFPIESISLLVEKEEIYLKDGRLEIAPEATDYISWLQPLFQQRVFDLYGDYFPPYASKKLEELIELGRTLNELKESGLKDHLFRVEGGLLPRDLYQIGQDLDLLSVSKVQENLIAFSKSYRTNFAKAEPGDFGLMATEAIKTMWQQADDKQKFLRTLFEKVNKRLEVEGVTADVHLSPFAYGNEFTAQLCQFIKETELDNYSQIDNLVFALRVDQNDQQQVKLEEIPQQVNFALSGSPGANQMSEAVNWAEENLTGRQVLVHAGLQEFPEEIFSCLSKLDSPQWQLHLDGQYQGFLDWRKGKDFPLDIIISPLVHIVNDPGVIRGVESFDKVEHSSNNPVITGGTGVTLQKLVVDSPGLLIGRVNQIL